MSRTIALVALAIVAVFISSDRSVRAAAPTTQPDLVAENATLKKLIAEDAIRNDQLLTQLRDTKNRNAALQIQLNALQDALSNGKKITVRSIPNEYEYQRVTTALPLPTPNPNSVLGSFNYNGKTVYLLGPLTVNPITVPAQHQDRTNMGTITLTAPVSENPVKP